MNTSKVLTPHRGGCPCSWRCKSRSTITIIISAHFLFLPHLVIRTTKWHFTIGRLLRSHLSTKYYHAVEAELKQNPRWWKKKRTLLHHAFKLCNFQERVLKITLFCTQTAKTEFDSLPENLALLFWTPKMPSLSLDNWRSKSIEKHWGQLKKLSSFKQPRRWVRRISVVVHSVVLPLTCDFGHTHFSMLEPPE